MNLTYIPPDLQHDARYQESQQISEWVAHSRGQSPHLIQKGAA